MTKAEHTDLLISIRDHGYDPDHPIITWQGQLLDGRHRARVCSLLGIDPPTKEYEGDDPLAFVRRENIYRRHLTDSQRAVLAAYIVTAERGHNQHTLEADGDIITRTTAAQLHNASLRTVDRAAELLRTNDQEAIDAVVKDRKAISTALREARTRRAMHRGEADDQDVHQRDTDTEPSTATDQHATPAPAPSVPSPWTAAARDAVVMLLLHRRSERILVLDADADDTANIANRLGMAPHTISTRPEPNDQFSAVAVSALEPDPRDWAPLWNAVRPGGRVLLHSADRTTPKGIRLVVSVHYSSLTSLGGTLGTVCPSKPPLRTTPHPARHSSRSSNHLELNTRVHPPPFQPGTLPRSG